MVLLEILFLVIGAALGAVGVTVADARGVVTVAEAREGVTVADARGVVTVAETRGVVTEAEAREGVTVADGTLAGRDRPLCNVLL